MNYKRSIKFPHEIKIYHCIYSDICYNIIRKRKEIDTGIKERLEERKEYDKPEKRFEYVR